MADTVIAIVTVVMEAMEAVDMEVAVGITRVVIITSNINISTSTSSHLTINHNLPLLPQLVRVRAPVPSQVPPLLLQLQPPITPNTHNTMLVVTLTQCTEDIRITSPPINNITSKLLKHSSSSSRLLPQLPIHPHRLHRGPLLLPLLLHREAIMPYVSIVAILLEMHRHQADYCSVTGSSTTTWGIEEETESGPYNGKMFKIAIGWLVYV